jgi:hypothetical protein
VERWYLALCRTDPITADGIADAIDQPAAVGPALGRPLVDRIHGSHHNMKELRPPSTGSTEVRLLFAFDPEREALFLVAGDKAGRWDTWYRQSIPIADDRFDEHLDELKKASQEQHRGQEGR